MMRELFSAPILQASDVSRCRQRARQIAHELGLEPGDQSRFATAASELARLALASPGGGVARFKTTDAPSPSAVMEFEMPGTGVNRFEPLAGPGAPHPDGGGGLAAARRLMDHAEVRPLGAGTLIRLSKRMTGAAPDAEAARKLAERLRKAPVDPMEEVEIQSRELARLLEESRRREEQMSRLNDELTETNMGVLALYAELDDKAERLRRADEVKTRFLSYISHEFRTPLNSSMSLARLLLDRADGPLTPEQEVQIQYLEKSTADLLRLVNHLLDMAKVEAGKITVDVSEFRIEDFLAAQRGMFRAQRNNPEVELIFEHKGEIPLLTTDEGKLAQIVRNLVANALKFTERGEVRTRASYDPHSDALCIEVIDTGIGLSPENQRAVFEDFLQIQNPLQKTTRGTGLGLPLSRRLARLLGGDLTVRSEPGGGSVFELRVPPRYPGGALSSLDEPAGPAAASEARPPRAAKNPHREPGAAPGSPKPIRALVIDDEELYAYLAGQALAPPAFDPSFARDGAEGLRLARELKPDVIVLDLQMPVMSGLEALKELRADPVLSGTPVILNTSQNLGAWERIELERDCFAVLTKASDFEPLRAAIERARDCSPKRDEGNP